MENKTKTKFADIVLKERSSSCTAPKTTKPIDIAKERKLSSCPLFVEEISKHDKKVADRENFYKNMSWLQRQNKKEWRGYEETFKIEL